MLFSDFNLVFILIFILSQISLLCLYTLTMFTIILKKLFTKSLDSILFYYQHAS